MNAMENSRNLPDQTRLSIVAGVIVLSYAMIPFAHLPAQNITIRLPFAVFSLNLEFGTLLSFFVALLAALGSDWLIQLHPHRQKNSLVQHGFLPALTALVIGVPLNSLHSGPEWWIVLALGAGLQVLILIAEYIVVDNSSVAHLPAAMGLTTVSFSLYLILAIALRAAGVRLYLLLPALVFSVGLLVYRTLNLRNPGGTRNIFWVAAISIFIGQIVIGLHYLPLRPLTFGLITVSFAYALTTFSSNFEEGHQGRFLWFEPLFLFLLLLSLSIFIHG